MKFKNKKFIPALSGGKQKKGFLTTVRKPFFKALRAKLCFERHSIFATI